jgi:hypothetical protein
MTAGRIGADVTQAAVQGDQDPSRTERIHGHIDELFASGRRLPEILEEVARLGARLLMQAALEAEITEFLGRDRCSCRGRSCAARPRRSRPGCPDRT